MIKVLVIADDLTGALDTGVQFAQAGVSVMVMTLDEGKEVDFAIDGTDVLVLDIESRHLPPGRAIQLVYEVVNKAIRSEIYYFYKKTDSTLRGNIGAELEGLLNASGGRCLTFVPAFPENGRTTRDGVQYVDDSMLAETVYAEDPFSPVKHSKVSDIIREQSGVGTEVIRKENYLKLKECSEQKVIRIVDAETRDDIREIGQCLADTENLKCLAGCAGFAEVLPELLGFEKGKKERVYFPHNVLAVSGSINSVTMNQIAIAETLGYSIFVLEPRQKLDIRYPDTKEFQEFCADIAKKIDEKGKILITAAKDAEDIALADKYIVKHDLSNLDIRHNILNNIGLLTAEIISRCDSIDLVVFGGDTLYSILRELQLKRVIPITAIASGVVASAPCPEEKIRTIISKAGGFGNEDILKVINDWRLEFRQKLAD